MGAPTGAAPGFASQVADRVPLATVVIPVFNAASTLDIQLRALANQLDAPPFEVIVADNGSTDESAAVAKSFARSLDIRVVDSSAQRGPSHARNIGARAASTSTLLFCDADDRVEPGWVAAMHRALLQNAMAAGPVIYVDATRIRAMPASLSDMRPGGPRRYLEQVTFGMSGNFAIRAELMQELEGFDCSLRCCEDADLTIRAQTAGHTLSWTQNAVVFSARRESLPKAARQFFRYGYYDAMLYRKLRGRGLSQRTPWQILRPYLTLAATLHRLLTRRRRWSWVINASQRAGRLAGSMRFRVFCP